MYIGAPLYITVLITHVSKRSIKDLLGFTLISWQDNKTERSYDFTELKTSCKKPIQRVLSYYYSYHYDNLIQIFVQDHSNSQEPKTLNHVKNPHESFYEFDTHDEVPKQKYARIRLEERQHLTDKHCNDSFSQDGSKEQHHSHGRIKKGLDFPLLITMTAWFIMIYFGIKKFIRVNAMNNKSYTKYLQGCHFHWYYN